MIVLVALIPWLVFRSDGDAARGAQEVPSEPEGRADALPDQLRHLPHALRGGHRRQLRAQPRRTARPQRPGLATEDPKATEEGIEERVLNALENGVDSTTTPGRMPAGILSGAQAEEVAEFVAHTAGEG